MSVTVVSVLWEKIHESLPESMMVQWFMSYIGQHSEHTVISCCRITDRLFFARYACLSHIDLLTQYQLPAIAAEVTKLCPIPEVNQINQVRDEQKREERGRIWFGWLLDRNFFPDSNRPRFPSAVPNAVEFSTRTLPLARSVKRNSTFAVFGALTVYTSCQPFLTCYNGMAMDMSTITVDVCCRLISCGQHESFHQVLFLLFHSVTVLSVVCSAGVRCAAMEVTSCT